MDISDHTSVLGSYSWVIDPCSYIPVTVYHFIRSAVVYLRW